MLKKFSAINYRSGNNGEKQDQRASFRQQANSSNLRQLVRKVIYQQNILNFVLFISSPKILSLIQLIKKHGVKEKVKYQV